MRSILLLSVLMVGCTKYTSDYTEKFELPAGLKDCKIYYMQSSDGNSMRVIRCPNSSTSNTYRSGKHTYYASVIDRQYD